MLKSWAFLVPQSIEALVLGWCRSRVWCKPPRLECAVPAHTGHPQPPSRAESICSLQHSSRGLCISGCAPPLQAHGTVTRDRGWKRENVSERSKQLTFTTSEHLLHRDSSHESWPIHVQQQENEIWAMLNLPLLIKIWGFLTANSFKHLLTVQGGKVLNWGQ